jgi:hypothetical protein
VSFPRTYASVKETIRGTLLQTKMARDIVRKSGIRTAVAALPAEDPAPPQLKGQFAHVGTETTAEFSVYGRDLAFPADTEFPFPEPKSGGAAFLGTSRLRNYSDWIGLEEVRLLATVTLAGPAGSELFIRMWRDTLWGVGGTADFIVEVPFAGGGPIVPLDEVGLHASEWFAIDRPPEATTPAVPTDTLNPPSRRPAMAEWYVSNPSGFAATGGVGLCQLQARG